MAGLSVSIPELRSFESLLSLEGRCAVVAGGGLGEAIVRRLAEAGAGVVMPGRGRPPSERLP